MTSLFWDARVVIFVDYLPKGSTSKGAYYTHLIWKLLENIARDSSPPLMSNLGYGYSGCVFWRRRPNFSSEMGGYSARVRKSGTLCHCSVTYLLPLLSPATSVWRLIYVFWAQRSTDSRADSTRCTQTSVYSARVKYIVHHWISRESSLYHSSGWGTETFPLSSVICAPVL